jgi:hypothetical protein
MIRRPALRFRTRPLPFAVFAARFFAAAIRPPLLFFIPTSCTQLDGRVYGKMQVASQP